MKTQHVVVCRQVALTVYKTVRQSLVAESSNWHHLPDYGAEFSVRTLVQAAEDPLPTLNQFQLQNWSCSIFTASHDPAGGEPTLGALLAPVPEQPGVLSCFGLPPGFGLGPPFFQR